MLMFASAVAAMARLASVNCTGDISATAIISHNNFLSLNGRPSDRHGRVIPFD